LEAGFAITPGAIFSGPVSARVMIVGQAPGVTEVEAQRPFNASSGRRLFQWLGEAGWEEADFRATQYMTAITKCFPGKSPGGRGDRAPSRTEQKLCAPFLERELALARPEIIVPVGGLAIRRFLGKVKLVEVVGTAVQDEKGHWIVPLPHPSGASLWLNKPEHQDLVRRAIEQMGKLRGEL
jgi:uracil-DNA glycosylase